MTHLRVRTAAILVLGLCALTFDTTGATTKTASKAFGVYVNVQPAATVGLSGTTFQWNSVKTTMKGYFLADNGPMTVTGSIRTSQQGGASSIVVLSPGDIQGGNGKKSTLPINDFALTCSGSGNSGTPATYAPALTPLKANGTAPCATWGAGATTRLNFTFALYLQAQGVQKGPYQSQNFSIIATAT